MRRRPNHWPEQGSVTAGKRRRSDPTGGWLVLAVVLGQVAAAALMSVFTWLGGRAAAAVRRYRPRLRA